MGVSTDCPIFSGTPCYRRKGKSYGFQIWPVHSAGPSKQKPIKNFRKGSGGISRDCPNFLGTPIISGTGKATDFKLASTFRVSERLKYWNTGVFVIFKAAYACYSEIIDRSVLGCKSKLLKSSNIIDQWPLPFSGLLKIFHTDFWWTVVWSLIRAFDKEVSCYNHRTLNMVVWSHYTITMYI